MHANNKQTNKQTNKQANKQTNTPPPSMADLYHTGSCTQVNGAILVSECAILVFRAAAESFAKLG
jgi:hypothetical protein